MVLLGHNELTLIPAWKSNHMPSKVWDEITYPFPNIKGCNHWSLGMDKLFHRTIYNGCIFLSMLGLKLTHVSERGPWASFKYNDHLSNFPGIGILIIDVRHLCNCLIFLIGISILVRRHVYVRSPLATVPLTMFQSNLKLDQNFQCSGLKCTLPITTQFCTRDDRYTVVTCAKFCCDRLSKFKTRALQILIKFRIRSKYH